MKYINRKKISIVLIFILLFIQLFRPTRNNGNAEDVNSIFVPDEVKGILETSCYDCHSNNTVYPWYTNIQPIGWWLNNHVNEGKREINFSEYNSYSLKRKIKKLKEIKEQIEKNEMPLSSYTFIHTDTKLDMHQKEVLLNWATKERNKLTDTISKQ